MKMTNQNSKISGLEGCNSVDWTVGWMKSSYHHILIQWTDNKS